MAKFNKTQNSNIKAQKSVCITAKFLKLRFQKVFFDREKVKNLNKSIKQDLQTSDKSVRK